MDDPWLVTLALASALFVSGLVLWRRLSRSHRGVRTKPTSAKETPVIAPDAPPPPLQPESELLRMVVILFGAESSALSPAAKAALSEAARRLTESPHLTVTVEGSADSAGNPSRNLILARDRAWAARRFLLDNGIAEERVRAIVLPPSAGRTEYERQRLRRVRLTWEAT